MLSKIYNAYRIVKTSGNSQSFDPPAQGRNSVNTLTSNEMAQNILNLKSSVQGFGQCNIAGTRLNIVA